MSGGAFGRLALSPNPALFALLYEPQLAADVETVLPHLLAIDATHLVMLSDRGILPRAGAAELLGVNRDLARRQAAGEEVLPREGPHRGLYMLYEQQFVARLGAGRGGAAHLARSRNDINATVTRMRLRAALLDLLADGVETIRALAGQAERHAETLMPAFTHLQPAQPSTLGHYLGAAATEQLRALEWLATSFELVNRSPMGAAAGAGTSFAVDPAQVAALLGFGGAVESAGEAVASRDYAAYVLAGAAILGVSLTRLALDLQTWASQAWGFLDWPDDLVGTSSIMPQKRNAFVLENLRGQAIHPVGALVNTLLGMKNTPFSNSVEVSGEATAHLWPAMAAIRTSVRLAELVLASLVARPERMRAALDRSHVAMTALANHLVERHGLAFREAHEAVARLVVALEEEGEGGAVAPAAVAARLAEIVEGTTGRQPALDPGEVARALDPRLAVEAARHGGGPAPAETRRQLLGLGERLTRLGERVAACRCGLADGEARLARAIEGALGGAAR